MNNKIKYEILWVLRKIKRKITKKPIILKKYGNRPLITNQNANQMIYDHIISGKPFMAGRFGATELHTMVANEKMTLGKADYPIFDDLINLSGFFPKNDKNLKKFCDMMFELSAQVDLLGVWFNSMEDYVVEKYSKEATLCRLSALEPWYVDNPWTEALKDKKVLVIHPFEKTILEQYKKRECLFENKKILPEFKEIYTIRAVQTIAGEKDERFKDWFAALEWMYDEAMKTDFDVAIIGCGAYGFPLAAKLKKAGKQAIHMGGALQLLFGIRGKRWDDLPSINKFYNEAWVRPDLIEVPKNNKTVENGCYW